MQKNTPLFIPVTWDGVPRIDTWLRDYLGTTDTPYHRKTGRYFLIAMAARALEPGCRFDYCLVLEGSQGCGKSVALRILGGDEYSDTNIDLSQKDSLAILKETWLYEFSEISTLIANQTEKFKSFLTSRSDTFRSPYATRETTHPRKTIISATTNCWDNRMNNRRFWPVTVGKIDLEKLASTRDQLLSEAFEAAKNGERFWPTQEEECIFRDGHAAE